MSELVQEREEKRKLLYYMRYTQPPDGAPQMLDPLLPFSSRNVQKII